MRFRYLFFVLALISFAAPAKAQVDSAALSQDDARIWAEVRKPYFRATKDDSLFVVNNSDQPFRYDYYARTDDLGFFESMFFTAKPGDVVGPMFMEGYAMLFKIASFDTLYRVRASHLYVKPEGKSRKDTLNAVKKANGYLKQIQQGADFAELAKKFGQDETAQTGGELGWLWEGLTLKEFDRALATAKKGDVFVVKTDLGAHVVKVTEDKVRDRGRVKVIPLLKKVQ